MLTYGATEYEFFCFTKDAAINDYPILCVELVKKKDCNKGTRVPQVKEYLMGCVGMVGRIKVELENPLRLIDFCSYPEHISSVEVFAGPQVFEILSIDLPTVKRETKSLEIAVIPGTIFGVMWQGLIKATADYQKSAKHTQIWMQRVLPFRDSS